MKFKSLTLGTALLALAGPFLFVVSDVSWDSTNDVYFREYFETVVTDLLTREDLYDPDLLFPRDYTEDTDELFARYSAPPSGVDPTSVIQVSLTFMGNYSGNKVSFHSTMVVNYNQSELTFQGVKDSVLPRAKYLVSEAGQLANITWSAITIFCPDDGRNIPCDENTTPFGWLGPHTVYIAMSGLAPPVPIQATAKKQTEWEKLEGDLHKM